MYASHARFNCWLKPAHFLVQCRRRLGQVVAAEPTTCRNCAKVTADVLGDHSTACMAAGTRTVVHHAMVDMFHHLCSIALLHSRKEVCPFADEGLRVDWITLRTKEQTCYDFSMVSATQSTASMRAAAVTEGGAAMAAELIKEQHYGAACAEAGMQLSPVCVDTFGAWGPQAYDVMKKIAGGLRKRSGLSFGMQYQLVLLQANTLLMRKLAGLMLANATDPSPVPAAPMPRPTRALDGDVHSEPSDPEGNTPACDSAALDCDGGLLDCEDRHLQWSEDRVNTPTGMDDAALDWIPRGREAEASRLVDEWAERIRRGETVPLSSVMTSPAFNYPGKVATPPSESSASSTDLEDEREAHKRRNEALCRDVFRPVPGAAHRVALPPPTPTKRDRDVEQPTVSLRHHPTDCRRPRRDNNSLAHQQFSSPQAVLPTETAPPADVPLETSRRLDFATSDDALSPPGATVPLTTVPPPTCFRTPPSTPTPTKRDREVEQPTVSLRHRPTDCRRPRRDNNSLAHQQFSSPQTVLPSETAPPVGVPDAPVDTSRMLDFGTSSDALCPPRAPTSPLPPATDAHPATASGTEFA
jgi:hypothetical protein